jgi:hypothetical protein
MPAKEPHRDETSSASRWFSPGLVRDDEIILRTIHDPHHIQDGKLSTSAAIPLDDLRSRGWSVDRKKFTSLWRVKIAHWRWQRRKPDLEGCYLIPIQVGSVRAIPDNTFSVTDDALWSNPAHGAVILSAHCGPGAARRARDLLMQAISQYVAASDAFSPTDTRGWSRGIAAEIAAIFRAAKRCLTFASV